MLGWPGLIWGHDVLFEVVRLVEYKIALADQLYPRWAPDLYRGFGSPIFVFYSPLFLFLVGSLDLLVNNLNVSIKIVVVALGVISALFMFKFLRRYSHRLPSLTATLFWIFAPYKFTDLYARNAYAEYTALCLLPVVLNYLVGSATETGRGLASRVGLFFAIAFLALAHNITFMLASPFLVIALFYLGVRGRLVSLSYPVVAGVGSTAFFLLPAIFHRNLVHIDELTSGRFDVGWNFASFSETFWSGGTFYYQTPIVLVILLATVVRVVRRRSMVRTDTLGLFSVVLLVTSLFAIFPFSEPLWRVVPLAAFVQFPWRFLVFLTLGTTLAFAYVMEDLSVFRKWVSVSAASLVLLSLVALHLWQYSGMTRVDAEKVTAEKIISENLSATVRNEYLPKEADENVSGISERAIALSDENRKERANSARYSECKSSPTASRVRFALFNFPFWEGRIDGRPSTLVAGDPEIGLDVPAGQHCVGIRLGFTDLQYLGFSISAVFLSLFLGGLLWDGRRSRKMTA
jgi:hypothetical protein